MNYFSLKSGKLAIRVKKFNRNIGREELYPLLEAVSKPYFGSKSKARVDSKTQHTREYVSILNRFATQLFGLKWDFETTSKNDGGKE